LLTAKDKMTKGAKNDIAQAHAFATLLGSFVIAEATRVGRPTRRRRPDEISENSLTRNTDAARPRPCSPPG
jgi:hypothetical protein